MQKIIHSNEALGTMRYVDRLPSAQELQRTRKFVCWLEEYQGRDEYGRPVTVRREIMRGQA